jgi:hypothetical protein
MEKTIEFTVTTELALAATAYMRRNALVVRLVLACIAVASIAACCLAAYRGNVIIAGWLLLMSLSAAYGFIRLQVHLLKPENRILEQEPIETRAKFTDDGFAYQNAAYNVFVPWTDLYRIRKTPVSCSFHFMHEGRPAFVVVPSDAIDRELGRLIDDHAPKGR